MTSDNGGLDDDNRCGLFYTVILLQIDPAHLDLLHQPRSPGHNCNPAQFQVNSIQPVCGTKSNSEQTNTEPGEGRGSRKKGKGELTLGLASNFFYTLWSPSPAISVSYQTLQVGGSLRVPLLRKSRSAVNLKSTRISKVLEVAAGFETSFFLIF